MKKVLLACILSLGTVAVLQAQDSTSTQSDRYANPSKTDQQTPTTTDQQTPATTGQQTPTSTDQQTPSQAKEGKDLTSSDLPAPIQDKLRSTDYSGWTVEKAKTKMKDGKTCYAVELKNGSDKKKILFDETGNIVKEKE